MTYAIIKNSKMYLPSMVYRAGQIPIRKAIDPIVTQFGYLYPLSHSSSVIAIWLKHGLGAISVPENASHRAILITGGGDIFEISLMYVWGQLLVQMLPINDEEPLNKVSFVTAIEPDVIEMIQYGLTKGFSVEKCIKAMSSINNTPSSVISETTVVLDIPSLIKSIVSQKSKFQSISELKEVK